MEAVSHNPNFSEDIPEIPPALVVTPRAAKKVLELMTEEGNFALKLRVFVQGGGCSGFQYGFAFEEAINSDDTVVDSLVDINEVPGAQSGLVQLIVDPMSLSYLAGAEIDYVCDINGECFKIRNPNAKTTCGCGSSFSD